MRSYLALALAIGAAACATIAGVDGDYHLDDSADASSGGTSSGGVGTGGITSDGGVSNGGTGAVGGASGAAGMGGGPGGSSGSGSSGGSGGGGGTCSDLGKLCAGAVPATFTGPVVLYESTGTPPAACPADYPQEVSDELHSGITAGSASCKCNCSTPSITCGAPAAYQHASAGCPGGVFLDTMTANVCQTFTVGVGNRVSVSQPTPTLGSCSSSNSHVIPAVTWGTDARSCGGASVAGECSGGEVCVPPQPSEAKLCVYKDGDVSCPAGYYSAKHLFHETPSDTRMCSPCSCGGASGGECKGSVVFTNGSSCGSLQLTLPLGGCSANPATNVNGGLYTPGTHTPGFCAPSGGVLSGSVTATGPVTYCCAP